VSQVTIEAGIVTLGRPAVSPGHKSRNIGDSNDRPTRPENSCRRHRRGYAGTLAANRLRQRPDIEITLVNSRPVFVERIRLHQLVADTGAATADYATLLGEGVRLIVDTVERIENADRRVQLASGAELNYDYLIYAVGSTGAQPTDLSRVPGAAEFAHSVADLEGAQRLHYALADLPHNAPITVVGAGLTGIETASELAEQDARDAALRRDTGTVAEQSGSAFGGQTAAQTRRQRAGIRCRERGALECRGAL